MAKDTTPIEFIHSPCTECKVVCVFIKGARALTFGHIYSAPGLVDYVKTGVCEWCSEILEDFAHMGKKGEILGG